MGLTSWKGNIVRKGDVIIAKNYLNKDELDSLNRLVNVFLESAELRVKDKQSLTMEFWKQNVDNLLQFQGKEVLQDNGSISNAQMEQIAFKQYEMFNQKRKEEEFIKAQKEDERILEDTYPKISKGKIMLKKQAVDKKQKLILNQIIKEEYKHYLDSFKNEDFISFTQKITLQDYQQEALRYAFIALDLFFKQKEQPYPQSLSFKYHKLSQEQNSKFEKQDSNRASFWMATGSGKTIVMIKLMSLLFEWISQGKIPKKPIMLLVPNDKILSQFKERIIEYNNFQNNALEICELKKFLEIL